MTILMIERYFFPNRVANINLVKLGVTAIDHVMGGGHMVVEQLAKCRGIHMVNRSAQADRQVRSISGDCNGEVVRQ
jgi:hypothetical protein